jgi:hypothetical protein
MIEAEVVAAGEPYGVLIDEVFIKPIRTVMVVDDEFPTVDALLQKELDGSGRWGEVNVSRARKIIQACREDSRRWVVDIHDGQNLNSIEDQRQEGTHFHHSDLMILDYHLNKDRPDDGGDAVAILRRLASNDHFNLVIVYTKGYSATGGEIPRVVREVALGLCSFDDRLMQSKKAGEVVKELLEIWEDTDEHIEQKILDAVDDSLFLMIKAQKADRIDWPSVCAWPELEAFRSLVESGPDKVAKKFRLFLQYSIHYRQESVKPKLAEQNFGRISWDLGGQSVTNWIRTDRLFVTVVSKTEEPSTLPDKLLSALTRWNPEPHRLLMSKMRAELDERGVLAEGTVLDNQNLQVGWLQEYLTEDMYERQWKVHSTINRHWEGLGDSIRGGVTEFAERLANYLLQQGGSQIIEQWYPSSANAEVNSYLNSYVSSKVAVEGAYLTTGHVIQLDGNAQESGFWLCLSPACDLVPGQKSSGWSKRLGEYTPFMAVELFAVKTEDALKNAFAGNHLFLKVDSGLRCFSFTPPFSSKDDPDGERTSNPKWEQMFVGDQGRFESRTTNITIARALGKDGVLSFSSSSARVVAHLRYEYALNLLGRLGANLSRVGLDFVAFSGVAISAAQSDYAANIGDISPANQMDFDGEDDW